MRLFYYEAKEVFIIKDLTGQRFGRLVVLGRNGSDKWKNVTWSCKCDCGNDVVVSGSYLRNGETKSCGCLQKEIAKKRMSTHGCTKTRLYRVWAGIKSRCYNPNSCNYQYYGAKGVEMCELWKNNFDAFKEWAFNNGYDENAQAQECTVDRIDNSLSYSPSNCRISNHTVQCNNQTSNKIFSYNGKTMTMAEWARIFGIKYTTLRARIRRGVPFEDAIKIK